MARMAKYEAYSFAELGGLCFVQALTVTYGGLANKTRES
jgi:hypothetical protein